MTLFLPSCSARKTCIAPAILRCYDGFVNALPYEEQRKVKEKQGEFSEDLRQDLSDPKGTFDSEYLTSAHQNLSGAKRAAPSEKIIFCYLCIRLDRKVEYRLEKESLARCDPEGAQEVEDFLHCFRNCRMNEVYHAVRLGKKLDPAWYDWQDDLGLTVLHYAILLKRKSSSRICWTSGNGFRRRL